MSDTAEQLRTEAEQRLLEVILAEIELAITLQRLSYSEHSVNDGAASIRAHGNAVESLVRARNLLSQVPDHSLEMWRTLDAKITELETLLQTRAA
ncbi:MAG: hypothetical protein ABJF23_30275 [Bryobacteraceae bacterium]